MKKVQYKGYTVVQNFYNYHIAVHDADGNMVHHASVGREETEDELKRHVDLYLAFRETIDDYLDASDQK